MDSIRNSLWSIIGLTSTAASGAIDKCLPADLLRNLESAKMLAAELGVAERNVDAFKERMKEFGSACSMTINDFSQLSLSSAKLADDLIAAAARLQQQTSTALPSELAHRVAEPLARWRMALDGLIVQLEEQRRMHHQEQLLRDHIRAREDARVRLMRTGKWSAKDGADLKRAQDALVAWRLKTEAVDAVVAEAVQRDLIDARQRNGLTLLKAFDAVDQQFWNLGAEIARIRTALIGALTSSAPGAPAPVKKKKKKAKKPAAAERDDAKDDERRDDGSSVLVDNAVPDILSSFECLRYEPDPFQDVAAVSSSYFATNK